MTTQTDSENADAEGLARGSGTAQTHQLDCLVLRDGALVAETRQVVAEEPLTIELGGKPLVTLMRMPGNERELALGYLITEGFVRSVSDIGMIAFCETGGTGVSPAGAARGAAVPAAASGGLSPANTLRVELTPGISPLREPDAHRAVFSSCSLCGAEVIDEMARDIAPFSPVDLPADAIVALSRRLRREQPVFELTGGTHAAALCIGGTAVPPVTDGTNGGLARQAGGLNGRPAREPGDPLVITREDIGRHNALDKAVGAAAIQRLPLNQSLLFLSGRLSFEMVVKAARAGIPVVAGVSAPTALAVQLARRLNMHLAGFARGDTFTLYAGPHIEEET